MAWKIYYGDGSTFSSKDGDPFCAPGTNAQVIQQNGKLQSGKDAYYWSEEMGWNGCDHLGMIDYLQSYLRPQKVIFGRTIRDEIYWGLRKRAGAEIEKSNH
jgi:hypothetical protein